MNPEKLAEDLFDNKNLSNDNLRAYSQDHLLRLSIPANNPGGIYSGIITATTNAFTAFFGKMDNEATQDAINQGLTQTTEAARANAIGYVSKLHNLVSFKFGTSGNPYQQFYPHGLSEYHDANLDQLPGLFTRIVTAANAHLLVSNPAEVAELITLTSAYNNARLAQLTGFGTVETLQTGRREDRTTLTLQLTTNLLTIAINNLGNPDGFNNYYNPSYLPLTEGALSVNGIIAAAATIMAVNEGHVTQHSHLILYNNGTEPLVFSVNDVPAVINPVHTRTIAAGTSEKVEDLPVFTKYYININNPSATENGKWKVTVE